MRRPELPAAWRVALALAALLLATMVALSRAPMHLQGRIFLLYQLLSLTGAIVGGTALILVARDGGRALLATAGAVALAVAFAIVTSSPLTFLLGVGLFGPTAALFARPHAAITAAGLLGAALHLWGQALLMDQRGPGGVDARAEPLLLVGTALLAAAYAGMALLAKPAQGARPASRRWHAGLVIAGVALLALSWAIGGNLLFVPLWPLALAFLALPTFARWRAHATAAAVMGALLLAGLLPVATCTVDPWSDAIQMGVPPDADAYPERKMLMQLGGHGPNWASGGGFAGERVHCPPWALALGAAWDVGLLATAWWARPRKDPAPS